MEVHQSQDHFHYFLPFSEIGTLFLPTLHLIHDKATILAEVKVSTLFSHHKIPIPLADHLIANCSRTISLTVKIAKFTLLQSYFLSSDESQARFQHLKQHSDPITEVYRLFYEAVIPAFTTFNRFLRETPCIYFTS